MVFALRIEKAMYVSLFKTNIVIFTFIIEFFVFIILPHWLTVVGAILIISSSVAITINRFRAAKRSRLEH